MLKDQIENDLKSAMREKKQLELDTLRMLRARIKNEEIAKQKEFGDPEIMDIVGSEIKRRKDSIEQYTQAGRPELAAKEDQEMKILLGYMPEQMSEEEVKSVIDSTLEGQTFTAAEFGKAMGMVMPKLKGKASGDIISKILKEKLK
jgi:uncharacterized protein